MPNVLRHIEAQALAAWRFVTLDMWRLTRASLAAPARLGVATLRVLYMTVQAYIEEGIGSLAGSLTYSTVLSLVPILAVIIGIAKGFGLQETVRDALMRALPGHEVEFGKAFAYVENYLSQVQGGLFIGVGLAVLFYTVLMLISTIEDAFNRLWQAPYARPWSRRVINYLGAFILFPLLLTISSGTTLFLSTLSNTYLGELGIISALTTQILGLVPYVVVTLGFVCLYFFVPNVRVHFIPALIAGLIAGIAFQIFQALYINGCCGSHATTLSTGASLPCHWRSSGSSSRGSSSCLGLRSPTPYSTSGTSPRLPIAVRSRAAMPIPSSSLSRHVSRHAIPRRIPSLIVQRPWLLPATFR